MMFRKIFGLGLSSIALIAGNVDSAVLDASAASDLSANKFSIVMSGSSIAFGGNKVQLGQSLSSWKEAVPGVPRCTNERVSPVMCTWDDIGLQVGTDNGMANVKFASLFLLAREVESGPLPRNPDGSPEAVSTVTSPPKRAFSGQLQLDGVEVTRGMRFSQVRALLDRKRNVRCGSRDCASPHGKFGDGAKIFFELDGRSETDSIARIGLSLVSAHK